MGKDKHKTITLAGASQPAAASYRARKALDMRERGYSYSQIAADLELESEWDAAQIVTMAYVASVSETADQMRSASEARILAVIRKANDDLALTTNQAQRTALYRVLLEADAKLSKLYGLEIPAGLEDADPDPTRGM